MTNPASLLTELLDDDCSLGTMLQSMSVTMAEALGYTDLDFLFLDRQHGSLALERLEHIVRAADLTDTPIVIRVPRDDTSMITALLDVGVSGIVLPQIETEEQIKRASSHVRYKDGRSLGTTTRAARFGDIEKSEYTAYVDTELALLPMIETRSGLKNVEAIAEMEEVTAILIGPGDLAYSLETAFWSERHLAAIDEICETVARVDCPVGIFVSTENQLHWASDDFSFVIYSNDVEIVRTHLQDIVE